MSRQEGLRSVILASGLILALCIIVVHLWSRDKDSSNPISEIYYIKAQKDEGWIEKLAGDLVALFTLVLTGATVGLYIATRSLWVATERLVKGADRTSEYQLRAYLAIESGSVTEFQDNVPNSFTFRRRNFGQTPAFKSRIHVQFVVYDALGIATFSEEFTDRQNVVMPGQMVDANFSIDVADFIGDFSRVVAQGEIRYTDAFKEKRTTSFCLENHSGGGIQFFSAAQGNEAT